MRKLRGYFDNVMAKHPELVSKLGTKAELINNPHFLNMEQLKFKMEWKRIYQNQKE